MSNDSSSHKKPTKTAQLLLSAKGASAGNIILTVATALFLYAVPPFLAASVLLFVFVFSQPFGGRFDAWLSGGEVGQFWYVLVTNIIIFALLLWLIRLTKETWRSIGVSWFGSRTLYYMVVGFLMYFMALIVVSQLANALLPIDLQQRQRLGFEPGISGVPLLLAFVSLVVMPPLIEEVLFRGYLYTRLRRTASVLVSALIISVLFAAAHLQFGSGGPLVWVAAIDTFVLSLILVWLREKTGAIWAAVGVHALKNGLAFLMLFHINL